ncbi:MAG: class I SAM-dependent methyltransferase [Thermoproteota archaeon]
MVIKAGFLVKKQDGEKALKSLRAKNLLERGFLLKKRNDFLIIPLTREISLGELKELGVSGEIVFEEFDKSVERQDPLSILRSVLSDYELRLVPRSFDVIGDICILQLPPELYEHRRIVGEAFLKAMRNIRIVLNKVEPLSGEYRVGGYEVLAGRGSTETIHREHGCIFKLDVSKVFFTPRLSAERIRVASAVREGEVICDLFAGIGPFSIVIAKRNPSVRVYACDINPDAYRYLVENIRLNKVEDRVKAFHGDARKLSGRELKKIADRVIMNLPMGSETYLDAAYNTLKNSGGIIHLHVFINKGEDSVERYLNVKNSLKELGYWPRLLSSRRIREVGPYKYHWGFDIEVVPLGQHSPDDA